MSGLAELAEAIEELDLPVAADGLADAFALTDRLLAKLIRASGELDAAAGWEAEGATSMVAWLKTRTRRSGREARALTSLARKLRKLPVTAEALATGALSVPQAQAIATNVGDEHLELFAAHEPAVVPALVGLSVADTATAMRHWAQAAEEAGEGSTEERPSRVSLSRTLDDRRDLTGDLAPEDGALVATALGLAESPDVEGEPPRSPAECRAGALVDIFRFFLDHQQTRRGGRHRPHLNLVIDVDRLADGGHGALLDGTVLDPIATSRLSCDVGIHRVVMAGRSTVLDYGTTTRTPPAPLWAALVVRDTHCRFGGCDRRPEWCEGHHVQHWIHDGPTCLDNLVLCCTRHHHLLHRPGWHAKLLPDATFDVTTPEGRVLVSRPPPRRLWREEPAEPSG